jgi:hypothetical protein
MTKLADLDVLAMTRDEVQQLIAIEAVMKRLGLSFYCLRCHARGIPDGVRASNDPQAKELVVACGCMVRKYHRETEPYHGEARREH